MLVDFGLSVAFKRKNITVLQLSLLVANREAKEKTKVKTFSERYGYDKTRIGFQIESIDDLLRNRLWNILDSFYWARMRGMRGETGEENLKFLRKLWCDCLKLSIYDIRTNKVEDLTDWKIYSRYRELEWSKVYDLLQFIVNEYPDEKFNFNFITECNRVLEEEKSYYQFIGKMIVPRATKEEIDQIEKALQSPHEPVRKHIGNSLKELSNKQSPVYANSMKESITAVEATLQAIEKNDLVLSRNVEAFAKQTKLHPHLQESIKRMSSYANDTEIRHTAKEDTDLDINDAIFFLANCASWVNFLKSKAQKHGLI